MVAKWPKLSPFEIIQLCLGSIFRVDSENRGPEAIWRMYRICKNRVNLEKDTGIGQNQAETECR